MTQVTRDLLERALQLSPAEREELIARLRGKNGESATPRRHRFRFPAKQGNLAPELLLPGPRAKGPSLSDAILAERRESPR